MTDLASVIVGGANSTGNLVIETAQRVLYDARRSFQDVGDQTGEAPFLPLVAPFKEGWVAYQSLIPYSGSPATPGATIAKFIRYNDAGQMVWQTAMNSTHGAVLDAGADRFMAGNSTHILVRRFGGATHDFYLLDMSADNGTYTMPGSAAFTLSASTYEWIDAHTGQYVAHPCGTGWVIFGIDFNGASSTVSIAGLDSNFALLGTTTAGTWGATEEKPRFVSDWNGTGPAIVQRLAGSTGSTKVWQVTFDGTAAPTIAASSTITLDQNTGSGAYREPLGNGLFDYAWVSSGDPVYWAPSDGTESFSGTNPYYWDIEDIEDMTWRGSTISAISPSVIDWDNTVPLSSRYHSDRRNKWPHVVRHSWANWATKTAGYVDIGLALPADATPGQTCSFGACFSDVDLDESCFAILNPTNGKVFYWTIIYWRETNQTTGCGDPCGDNTLTSYWIVQLGEPVAPPTLPLWVNFFDLSGVAPADCPMLGTGSHDVFLYDRGGARKIGKITGHSTVRYNRVRDDVSSATIIVDRPDPDCCQLLADIDVGRHEIVIFRNGERAWEGPVTRMAYKAATVEITAHDICHYISRTIMHRAYDNRYSKKKSKVAPVTRRMQVILANEMARKERLSPSYNILRFLDVRTHAKTTRTSRFTHAYSATVWEEMDYLAAKLSLDYTVLGRRLIINDVHDILGRTEMLTDKDFSDELVITVYGMELATRSAVTDGQGHWAAVGGIDDFYGEVELLNTTYGEEVQPATAEKPTAEELKALMSEMASQAQRNLAGRYPVPTVVRVPDNTQLSPSAPVDFTQLVPGVRVPIRTTTSCLILEQEQKLDKVQVEETRLGEKVSITLSPAPGTTPWDDSSETAGDTETG